LLIVLTMRKRTFVFLVPLVSLLSLLSLLGCTSEPSITPPSADAGVDASASPDAGDASDAADAADVPDAADASATCETPCAAGELCINGACAPVDVLDLTIRETVVLQSGAVYMTTTTAQGCGSLAAPAWTPVLPAPLAVEGACTVWSYEPGSIAPGPAVKPIAPGGVKITTPTGMFSLQTMGTDCATAAPKALLFTQGGPAAFDGDGTGHFPAFHLELMPPAEIELASGPLVRGQPFPLTWKASAATPTIGLYVVTIPKQGITTTPPWIQCEVLDTGSYTIPATLTALLDPESTFANVLGSSSTRTALAPASAQVVILAGVTRIDQLLVDYTP
jgi:hypothetical protein